MGEFSPHLCRSELKFKCLNVCVWLSRNCFCVLWAPLHWDDGENAQAGRTEWQEGGKARGWEHSGLGWHCLQLECACRAGEGQRPRKALGQVSQPLAPRRTWKQVKSMELGWDVLRHTDSSCQ